jgi:hypothetical protein
VSIDLGTEDGIQRNRLSSANDESALLSLKEFIEKNKFCYSLKMKGVNLCAQGFGKILEAFNKSNQDFLA